jgi:hypothetical protein
MRGWFQVVAHHDVSCGVFPPVFPAPAHLHAANSADEHSSANERNQFAMDTSNLQMVDIQALRSNFTVAEGDLEHLLRCWSHQSCGSCLDAEQCSWCPYVSLLKDMIHQCVWLIFPNY